MFVATGEFDLLLGDISSLKAKRAIVRPLVAELRRRFAVAAAEVGDADLHRRAVLGVCTVSNEAGQAAAVVRSCEDWLAAQPATELLSARVRVVNPSEDFGV